MDTIVIRNITIFPQDTHGDVLLEDVQFRAQLIIEGVVHDETEEVGKEESDLRWQSSECFLVPVIYTSFLIGIIKMQADGVRTHQGAVEFTMERIEPYASKQETHFVVQTSSDEDEDILNLSFTAYSSTSNLAKGPSPPSVLSMAKSMDCEAITALLTQIVISDTAFMNPDLGLLSTIHAAIIKLPGEGVRKPRALGLLANVHLARYDSFSSMMGENAERYPMFVIYSKGIDKAILMLDAALALASDDHPKRPWMVLSLSMCLQRKLILQTSRDDPFRTTALKMSRVLLRMPDDEPKKPIFCNHLGESLGHCFAKSENSSDLDLSILSHEGAVRLTVDDSPYKITFLVNLISSIQNRVRIQRQAEDTDRLLVLQEQLLSLVPTDFPGRLLVLRSLGDLFFVRYKEVGDVESIEKSIRMYEEALTLLPDAHTERPSVLNNLAASLSVSPRGPDSLPKLRKAIKFVHQAIQLTPSNDPLRLQFTANLGNSILTLFEVDAWDLEEFKMYNQVIMDAISFTSDDDGLGALITNFESFTNITGFKGLSDSAIIDTLVPLYKSTIDAFPSQIRSKASLLYNLSCSLFTTFDNGRCRQLLDDSIDLLENAIGLWPEDSPKKVMWTSMLSSIYLSRYISFHQEHDWDTAETLSPSSLKSLPSDRLDLHIILRNLGRHHIQRFCRTGDIEYLHRSIEIYRDVIRDLNQESQLQTSSRSLIEGSDALFRRFQLLGMKEDIDEAISTQELALVGFYNDPLEKVGVSFNLSKLLYLRFHHFHNMDDLDRACAYLDDSAILSTSNKANATPSIHEYYDKMSEYFQTFSGNGDVESCVKEMEFIATVSQRPEADLRIHNIGMFLSIRLPRSTYIFDVISKQIFECLENAVKLLKDTSFDKGVWLSILGDISLRMFAQSRLKDDLDKAVLLGEEAIRLHRDDTISRKRRSFLFIVHLASSLHQRFKSSGELADLNRSINLLEDASMICPKDDPNKYRILDSLGISLTHRYDLLGDIVDLNNAAHALLEARVHVPDDDFNQYILQQNIGGLSQRRLKLSGNREDAQTALNAIKLSVQGLPEGSPEQLNSMVAYSKALLHRFWHFRAGEDLEEATEMLENVLSQVPCDSRQRASVLHDLGSALAQRFVQHSEVDDINRCISLLTKAKELMPDDNPGHYMLLFDLGRWLPARYERLNNTKDLEDANDALRRASSLASAPYMWRFRAASLRSYWTQTFVEKGGSAEIDLEGYKDALALLPKIAWLGMPIQSRQWHLVETGDVVLDAVAAAIQCSHYDLALEWLELGRSVTWGQLIELRTPVDVLQDSHPVLAARFAELSRTVGEMESVQPVSPQLLSRESAEGSSIPPTRRYHELADEREKLLQRIRTFDGFQSFLSPKSISDLLEVDFKGPVITLNINKFRCDALALMPGRQVLHIPLDKFSASEAHSMMKNLKLILKNRNALRSNEDRAPKRSPFARRVNTNPETEFKDILAKLWICVAKPVLDEIGLMNAPEDSSGAVLPRIWWCLTGPMILLPIHAAGLYGSACPSGSKFKVSDFAVSSYTPSLSALMRCSRPRHVRKKSLVAVALPVESALPCTQTEIELIQLNDGLFPVECLIDSAATYQNVVRGLENAGWAHFACHGVQDKDDPTQSALLLSGDRKLTLSDISKLSLPHAELAFLSACQTATGDELLPEEAIHLTAGMLLAGYQGVVGTMWSIPDVEGPRIADEFYRQILSGGDPDPAQAAYALHASTKALRDNSDARTSFFSWVPFVHYGL